MRPKFHMWYQWFLGLFLNCIDYFETKAYINKIGELGEFNPLMLSIIQRHGIIAILYTKIGFFLLLGSMMLFVAKKSYPKIGYQLACMNIVFGCVIGWGIYCLLSV